MREVRSTHSVEFQEFPQGKHNTQSDNAHLVPGRCRLRCRSAGRTVHFLFVFVPAGHGDVDDHAVRVVHPTAFVRANPLQLALEGEPAVLKEVAPPTIQTTCHVTSKMLPYNILLMYVVWYGMVWHGMAWHGMAWHGMAWHGMV